MAAAPLLPPFQAQPASPQTGSPARVRFGRHSRAENFLVAKTYSPSLLWKLHFPTAICHVAHYSDTTYFKIRNHLNRHVGSVRYGFISNWPSSSHSFSPHSPLLFLVHTLFCSVHFSLAGKATDEYEIWWRRQMCCRW